MNRVNKKNAVSDTKTVGSNDEGVDSDGPVDLGIGISVDLDVGARAERDSAIDSEGAVELTFDERETIAVDDERANEVRNRTDARDAAIDVTAIDGPRLEPDEREALEAADLDPEAAADKEYSYRMLLDADVDESTADALRRRFSLPWSFESDGDLERRSSEVRGLGAAEREWIAVSGDEDWQSFEYEHSIPAAVGRERPAERPWPKPTPVTAVTGVGPGDADALAEAGVRSAERLATVGALEVANALDLNVLHVRMWRHNARELLE